MPRKACLILLGLIFLGPCLVSTVRGQELPTGNPKDFKVKTCLHSIGYAGVWRGQATLPLDDFLVKAKQMGYDGVEIMAKRPHLSPLDYDTAARQRLRARMDQLGLKVVALAAYSDFTVGLDQPGIPQVEIQATYLGEVAHLAHDIGCNMIRVFTGFERPGAPYDKQYALVMEGLRQAGLQAQKYGVTLAIQNHHDFGVDAEGMYWLVKEINLPNVMVAWDAWSPSVQGMTPEQIRQTVLKLKPYIVHTTAAQYIPVQRFHMLSDLVNYEKSEPVYRMVPMGPGIVDYDSFINALKEIGYRGYIAYEMCAVLEGGGSVENLDRTAKLFLEYVKKFR
jgi:sugar phosphate isomerase/epimerase